MNQLSENEVSQMLGSGYLGEVRQGPDGNLYQYLQAVDGLGNPVGGFWSRLKRRVKRVVRSALPLVQQIAPFIPGGAAALTAASPFLKRVGVSGYNGIGALYEAADGRLYQMDGLGVDDEIQGIDDDQIDQMSGGGYLGELRQGADGNIYQYMQGIDGLGNLTGFWSRLRRVARRALRYQPAAVALRAASPYLRKALPVVQQAAAFIPGGEAALRSAAPVLKEAGVTGTAGLGALYQAEDGTLYQQVQGEEGSSDALGLDVDEELQGFDDDPELMGFDEDEELRGFEEADLTGIDDYQDVQGIEGYVRQDGMSGLDRYEREKPPQTKWHTRTSTPPEAWKPLW